MGGEAAGPAPRPTFAGARAAPPGGCRRWATMGGERKFAAGAGLLIGAMQAAPKSGSSPRDRAPRAARARTISTRCRSPPLEGRPGLRRCANEQFREARRLGRAAAKSGWIDESPSSTPPPRAQRFLRRSHQFDSNDDGHPRRPPFHVRFARLKRDAAISLIDKTAQIETEKSLRAEMLRDSLTGLPNRFAFNEKVEAVLEDPAFLPGSHAVLVLDMTRFSRVNECVGALAGDELLITFARRLFSALRAGDVLARTGGDEFGILMRLDRGARRRAPGAERIKAVLAAPFRLSELEIRVDCAIGCAVLSGSEESAEEVLRNAQFALKRAKASGQVQIYEPNQARAARRRFSIETELRRAIEADELTSPSSR
jgi:diguanylate cyclase (GGDEF)-like protein